MKHKNSDVGYPPNNLHLARLIGVLQTARVELCNADLQLPMLIVFFEIARHPKISLTELQQNANLSQSSVSRIVAKLGRGTPGNSGLDLVQAFENPISRRSKLVELTDTGASALSRMLKGLEA